MRFGKPDATAEQIEAAARAANAHEFVTRLPDGYATVIGERGIKLSGGQRQRVALVTQDTYLFNETLRANILIAKPEATTAELDEAVHRASLGSFVEALPDGLETRVGERGVLLSGGQRQRVAIARAFLKDAQVLILDEATSHLDAVNERAVRHALEELMTERTTIVIAHRRPDRRARRGPHPGNRQPRRTDRPRRPLQPPRRTPDDRGRAVGIGLVPTAVVDELVLHRGQAW